MRQGSGGLGHRLQLVMDRAPRGPVVVVGTDIPAIRSGDIANAFRKLGSHDAVFGPSSDGGYWLVGLRRRPRRLRPFDGVRWSSEFALADTLRNLNGRRVALLGQHDDIDEISDWQRLSHLVGRRITPVCPAGDDVLRAGA